MSTPTWALTISYALHMLATVLWIGGLSTLALLVLPAVRTLDPTSASTVLSAIQRRLDALGWFSLAVLAGTGLFQMSAHEQYQGFLAIDSTWSAAILVKHLVFGGMVVLSGYLTWSVMPRLQRQTFRQAQLLTQEAGLSPGSQPAGSLASLNNRLLWLNFFLAIIVLLLTAIARAS